MKNIKSFGTGTKITSDDDLKDDSDENPDASNMQIKTHNTEADEQERQLQEIMKIQEEEKKRYILERMDWDKNFGGDGDGNDDVQQANKIPAFMSEYEENQDERRNIVKCGKILWSSIIFGLYMILALVVIRYQLKSEQLQAVNVEIDDFVRSLSMSVRATDFKDEHEHEEEEHEDGHEEEEHEESLGPDVHLHDDPEYAHKGSNLINLISLDAIKNINDTIQYMREVVPNIGQ